MVAGKAAIAFKGARVVSVVRQVVMSATKMEPFFVTSQV